MSEEIYKAARQARMLDDIEKGIPSVLRANPGAASSPYARARAGAWERGQSAGRHRARAAVATSRSWDEFGQAQATRNPVKRFKLNRKGANSLETGDAAATTSRNFAAGGRADRATSRRILGS